MNLIHDFLSNEPAEHKTAGETKQADEQPKVSGTLNTKSSMGWPEGIFCKQSPFVNEQVGFVDVQENRTQCGNEQEIQRTGLMSYFEKDETQTMNDSKTGLTYPNVFINGERLLILPGIKRKSTSYCEDAPSLKRKRLTPAKRKED